MLKSAEMHQNNIQLIRKMARTKGGQQKPNIEGYEIILLSIIGGNSNYAFVLLKNESTTDNDVHEFQCRFKNRNWKNVEEATQAVDDAVRFVSQQTLSTCSETEQLHLKQVIDRAKALYHTEFAFIFPFTWFEELKSMNAEALGKKGSNWSKRKEAPMRIEDENESDHGLKGSIKPVAKKGTKTFCSKNRLRVVDLNAPKRPMTAFQRYKKMLPKLVPEYEGDEKKAKGFFSDNTLHKEEKKKCFVEYDNDYKTFQAAQEAYQKKK